MANLYELTHPISDITFKVLRGDPRKPLESLQGNILHGHGRDRAVHMFLRFTKGKRAAVKRWIMRLAEDITSAQQQYNEIQQYRQCKRLGGLFRSFFLSASGYTYLGLALPQNKPGFDDEAFRHGMKAAQHRLNDPLPHHWEQGYRQAIDAMVLLADDDADALRQEVHRLRDEVKAHAEICAIEHGKAMWNAQKEPVEHFGYTDGLSQPLFFQSDLERKRQKGERTSVWDPGAGPDIVLVPDPYGREGCDSGSYLVFRKLEQNVRAFKRCEHNLARALGLTGEDAERAGALAVGRFEDGTPVVLQPTDGLPTNSFTYAKDPDGARCPLQAHIRKVNPRQKGIPRIVRRGITYGERAKEPKDEPSLQELPANGVGLLFMCYQSNIAKQFEFLQYALANNPRFPGKQAPGIDAVIGQPGGSGVGQHTWPAHWKDRPERHKPFDFYGFVTLKGGEYFFAPSIYFLKHIAHIKTKS
jgi:Dyp-type peroxidase family